MQGSLPLLLVGLQMDMDRSYFSEFGYGISVPCEWRWWWREDDMPQFMTIRSNSFSPFAELLRQVRRWVELLTPAHLWPGRRGRWASTYSTIWNSFSPFSLTSHRPTAFTPISHSPYFISLPLFAYLSRYSVAIPPFHDVSTVICHCKHSRSAVVVMAMVSVGSNNLLFL